MYPRIPWDPRSTLREPVAYTTDDILVHLRNYLAYTTDDIHLRNYLA